MKDTTCNENILFLVCTILYLKVGELLNEIVGGSGHEVKEDVLLYVSVLVNKALYTVGDGPCVVLDTELHLPLPPVLPLHVLRVTLKLRV